MAARPDLAKPERATDHWWVREPPSEPLRCRKCGIYYAEAAAWKDCPAMRESA